MLLQTEKTGVFTGGSADMMCVLKLPTGRFHVAFFEENPMPGPVQPIAECQFLRLKSKMHHTTGAATMEEARTQLAELRAKILLPDNNVIEDVAVEVEDPVNVLIVGNWVAANKHCKEYILQRG